MKRTVLLGSCWPRALVDLKLVDQLPDELSPIRISSHKLQQLFVNLLLNAVYACQKEGQIELTAGQTIDSLWLAIADNGCGIETDKLGRIFDPFFTTKAPGEGTGLGLTICHRIVEEAGGRVMVESQLGKGSCFKVEFPKS